MASPKCFSFPPTFPERASPAYTDYKQFRDRVPRRATGEQQVRPLPFALPPNHQKLADGGRVHRLSTGFVARGPAIPAPRARVCQRRSDPRHRGRPQRLEGLRSR